MFTKQSGDAVVTSSSSKSTTKKKQKEGKDDPTTPSKTAKNIFKKTSAKIISLYQEAEEEDCREDSIESSSID